jgi:hypothetical protein
MKGTGDDAGFVMNDADILFINSPMDNVGGPYVVVYKDTIDRWAIVAMNWDNEPRLGIRWFWGGNGNPTSSGHATWLVLPPLLQNSTLDTLAIGKSKEDAVKRFLNKDITGEELNRVFYP